MSEIQLTSVVPILAVRDVPASADYFRDRLGFGIDFLYGEPPFYGAVSRGQVCLHLRGVKRPPIPEPAVGSEIMILATIEVSDVRALFEEFTRHGAEILQAPTRHPWGGTDLLVRDPDGNVISFVTYG